MKALIVGGGSLPSTALLLKHFHNADLTIAADRGLEAFAQADVIPDLLVGDMDSCDPSFLARYVQIERLLLPQEKDQTDLEAAFWEALRREADEFVLLGVTGGRVDHLLGNLALLRRMAGMGLMGRVEDEKQTIEVIVSKHTFQTEIGETVSILPAAPIVQVSATGLRYPLEQLLLSDSSARGVSNVAESEQVTILADGPIFLVRNKMFRS